MQSLFQVQGWGVVGWGQGTVANKPGNAGLSPCRLWVAMCTAGVKSLCPQETTSPGYLERQRPSLLVWPAALEEAQKQGPCEKMAYYFGSH